MKKRGLTSRTARCGILLISIVALRAQVEQGAITGAITDPSGSAVAAAQVIVTNSQTGVRTNTKTNVNGYYSVPYLAPGEYEVSVENAGFSPARFTGIDLTVGLTATINVKLELGAVQIEVRVTANSVQLEQQSSALGTVVSGNQVTELPSAGRDPYNLIYLDSSVVLATGAGPIIAGGRGGQINVRLDGADSMNTTALAFNGAYHPPLEAVQEFKLITNNYSSEYGRTASGVLTAASRSGTNELHGSFYEFLQNDKLNANGWNNNRVGLKKNSLRWNEYGFSTGGPVYLPKVYNGRNRNFFFMNFEKNPQRTPNNILGTVPTALQRQGDFSQTLTGSGNLITIYDPASTVANPNSPGNYIRTPFSGNKIPEARFNPISVNVMQFYPLPNRNTLTQNFILNGGNQNDTTKLFLRFDQAIGQKNRLFLSIGRQNSMASTPTVNVAYVPGTHQTTQSGLYVLSDTVIFRPSLLGEFRLSAKRGVNIISPPGGNYDFTQLGFPQSLKAAAETLIFPLFEVTDADSVGAAGSAGWNDAQYNVEGQAHLTWVKGAHTFKFGLDWIFSAFNVRRPLYPSGDYQFSRSFTQGPNPSTASTTAGYGVATFLLGAPTGGQWSFDPSLATSQKYAGGYLQDDWKARRNLTLNLGMRWEYNTPWTDRYNQLGFFDPNATDPVTGRRGVLRFVGVDGNPRTQTDPNWHNIAPRVGVAWSFAKNMVLRMGYGFFYSGGIGQIGDGVGELGLGFQTTTAVYLGPPVAAPNTPPAAATVANAFQSGLLYPPSTQIGGSLRSFLRYWPTPLSQQWNFSIQRTLPRGILLETAYLGNRGEHYFGDRNINAASAQYLSLGNALNDLVPNPFYGKITTGTLSAPTVRRSALLTPYPQYTGVTQARAAYGDSIYHAFMLRVERRMARGLTVQANYTISKTIDDSFNTFAPRTSVIVDPNNLKLSRSLGEWDRPQYAVANFIYELPFGIGKQWLRAGPLARVIGSWQVSGVTTFGSGIPMVITGPCSTSLPGISCTALRLKNSVLPSHQRTIDRYFDTTAFAVAPAFSMGNDSRTEPQLRAPGTKNFDLGIMRNQRFREQRINLQFRAELFSAFNHTQLGIPVGSVNSPSFGAIQSATGTRTTQLGLRLSY